MLERAETASFILYYISFKKGHPPILLPLTGFEHLEVFIAGNLQFPVLKYAIRSCHTFFVHSSRNNECQRVEIGVVPFWYEARFINLRSTSLWTRRLQYQAQRVEDSQVRNKYKWGYSATRLRQNVDSVRLSDTAWKWSIHFMGISHQAYRVRLMVYKEALRALCAFMFYSDRKIGGLDD